MTLINPDDPVYPSESITKWIQNPVDPEAEPLPIVQAKPGMTIRTAIARDIMSSLMSTKYLPQEKVPTPEICARVAVGAADCLILELNKAAGGRG
jgi:hypothetical protein